MTTKKMGTEVPRFVWLQGLFLPRGSYAARRTSPKYASFAFIAFARITFFACRIVWSNTASPVEPNSGPLQKNYIDGDSYGVD